MGLESVSAFKDVIGDLDQFSKFRFVLQVDYVQLDYTGQKQICRSVFARLYRAKTDLCFRLTTARLYRAEQICKSWIIGRTRGDWKITGLGIRDEYCFLPHWVHLMKINVSVYFLFVQNRYFFGYKSVNVFQI